jgi:hypothetical protein
MRKDNLQIVAGTLLQAWHEFMQSKAGGDYVAVLTARHDELIIELCGSDSRDAVKIASLQTEIAVLAGLMDLPRERISELQNTIDPNENLVEEAIYGQD